jgi:hypothetical protein
LALGRHAYRRRELRVDGSFRRVILVCEECGERMVVGGSLSVWRSATASFECECGTRLKLAHLLERKRFVQVGSTANTPATNSPQET